MELSIPSTAWNYRCEYSFLSSSFLLDHLDFMNIRNPRCANSPISAVTFEPQQRTKSVCEGPLEELRRLKPIPKQKQVPIPPETTILNPPSNSHILARRLLSSPQLTLKSFPLLSSCLPIRPLTTADETWIDGFIPEAKQALGYPLEPSFGYGGEEDNPGKQFDTLLYLALQYPACQRTKAFHVRSGHSRLAFLGSCVLELALAEYLLQRYPRETTGQIRYRTLGMIGNDSLPKRIKAASLQNLVFQYDDMRSLQETDLEPVVQSVFSAIFGAIYVCFGLPEVYRVLFEAFGADPDAEDCLPGERRHLPDVDYVIPELEAKCLSWKDVAFYKAPHDALFRYPRLFRACVPPGMHKFRGNYWDYENKPRVMQALGYPLPIEDKIPEMTEARNIELGLGLQLCHMHPMLYKEEHPRFCFERLEYLGQSIQSFVMAERLVMKHLDTPGIWLQKAHQWLLLDKLCLQHLRAKNIQNFIIYDQQIHFGNRFLRKHAMTSILRALHGLGYAVYGKPEVWRLMFDIFDFERNQHISLPKYYSP